MLKSSKGSGTGRDVFRAVADPTRREILDQLAVRELPVTELASSFRMSLPAVSQHLKVLREAGLVSDRREGRQHVYTLVPGPLKEVSDWVDVYERFWRTRLQKLRDHLEKNS
jgi:DNA-binding transcriptional ArsR family regulator